jgi:hypothetical protein
MNKLLRDIFDTALEIADAAQRADFFASECAHMAGLPPLARYPQERMTARNR